MAKRKVNRQRSPLPEVQTPYQILKAVQSGAITEKELRQQCRSSFSFSLDGKK